jgi:membrane protein insertase Oxa1/YidC/SpoIIIJ
MELDAMMFWNIILSLVVAPAAWAFGKMFQEVKRLQILLNKTREEYATRDMVNSENKEVIALLRRLEDKFDRFVERQGWSQQDRK